MTRLRSIPAIAIGTAAALVACTSVPGVEQLPRGAVAEGTSAPSVYAEPACAACVASRCGALEAKCMADAPCRALATCSAGCKVGDLASRGTCEERQPTVALDPLARDF